MTDPFPHHHCGLLPTAPAPLRVPPHRQDLTWKLHHHTRPRSWHVPPLGHFRVDAHIAAGTAQLVTSRTSQCPPSLSSVTAQLNKQLGATQSGPQGRRRRALPENNAEKSMFLLILLKRSCRSHHTSEQELKKSDRWVGHLLCRLHKKIYPNMAFFWKTNVTGQQRDISGGPIFLGHARASHSPTRECSVHLEPRRAGLLPSAFFTMTEMRAPASDMLSGTLYQATQKR